MPTSPLAHAIAALANRQSLSERHTTDVFAAVMRGEATPAQIGALLMGLRVKGETPEEVAGAARALRDSMVRVVADGPHLVDTCGTGGGTVSTFNISTAAAFVAAGAGASVAKHGNRSFTSKCGSADVLEALGVPITLDAAAAARVLREACLTFLFAPTFHPAMKHAGPVRRELAVPSVLNLLGPLANPAGVRRQVVGVADADRAPLVAGALARLGAEHALVVHGRIGMDEIAPQGITDVWEVRSGGGGGKRHDLAARPGALPARDRGRRDARRRGAAGQRAPHRAAARRRGGPRRRARARRRAPQRGRGGLRRGPRGFLRRGRRPGAHGARGGEGTGRAGAVAARER